jgi:hypothetical protein
MMLDRRTLLASVAGLTACSRGLALSEDGLPALVGYERETGGRIGVFGPHAQPVILRNQLQDEEKIDVETLR